MRSNRTIQTIIQAVMLVMLAAIVFRMPTPGNRTGPGHVNPASLGPPSKEAIRSIYRSFFNNDQNITSRAQLLSVVVKDISQEGTVALVKLQIELKWVGFNEGYTDGAAKNASGQQGDTVKYTAVFQFRHWEKGWDIEEPARPR